MKIAAIHAALIFLDPKATAEKALSLMREAATNGAELCAFPEVFIPGYPIWMRPHIISRFSHSESSVR